MYIVSLTANIADIVVDRAQDACDHLKRNQEVLIGASETLRSLANYRSILLGPEPSHEISFTVAPTFPAQGFVLGAPTPKQKPKHEIGFRSRTL